MNKQPQGFTLLYSILIIGALLSIVFSIITITYKQVTLSGTARDSQVAFYMADTGAECARYWDDKGAFSAKSTNSGGTVITCGGTSIRVGGTNGFVNGTANSARTQCPGDENGVNCALSSFTLKYTAAGSTNKNEVKISLYKNVTTDESTLVASGHNVDDATNPRQVERSVKLVYTPKPTTCPIGNVMLLIDVSGSTVGTGNASNIETASENFIRALKKSADDGNATRIGAVLFGNFPYFGSNYMLTDPSGTAGQQNIDTLINTINAKVEQVKNSGQTEGTNMMGALRIANYELTGFKNSYSPQENGFTRATKGTGEDSRLTTAGTKNTIIIITDGSPHQYIHYTNGTDAFDSTNGVFAAQDTAACVPSRVDQYGNPIGGCTPQLRQTAYEADVVKRDANASIYVVGINMSKASNQGGTYCEGYSNCLDYVDKSIAGRSTHVSNFGSVQTSSQEPATTYIKDIASFDDLDGAVQNLTQCQ